MIKNYLSDEYNHDLGYLIWRISKYWQRGKHKALDEFGLTVPQLEMLGAIYHMQEHKKEATQIALSQETDIDPMTTSTILRNLQRKGLVNRKASITDTRARIVEITADGLALFLKAIEKAKSKQKEIFKDINKELLTEQLQLILKELDKEKYKTK